MDLIRKTAYFMLVLIFCTVMVVGGTLAWFTGAAGVPDDLIQLGTVDLQVAVEADQESVWMPHIPWLGQSNAKSVTWKITNTGTLPLQIRAKAITYLSSKFEIIPIDIFKNWLIRWELQSLNWREGSDGYWYYDLGLEPKEQAELSFDVVLITLLGILGDEYKIDLVVEGLQQTGQWPTVREIGWDQQD